MAKKCSIYTLQGKAVSKTMLPSVFETPLRPDVIKRAVLAIQSHRFQPQGRDPRAGKRTTAESRGVGLGISRVPRIKGGNRAAFGVSIVGGHRAHPSKSEKEIGRRIPRKEMNLALRSAIAATGNRETVARRGHLIDDVPEFPLIAVDDIEQLQKTKEVENVFLQLGVWADVFRAKESRKVRAGKGKMRGRRYKQAVGPLLVVSGGGNVCRAARNLPGVNATQIERINAEMLAPGTHPGRLAVWSKSAFERLNEQFNGSE